MKLEGLELATSGPNVNIRVRIRVHVQPGASRDSLVGVQEGALKLRIAAPPVDGEANDRCQKFLARDILKLPRSQVQLVQGEKSRHKTLEISGLSSVEVQKRLEDWGE